MTLFALWDTESETFFNFSGIFLINVGVLVLLLLCRLEIWHVWKEKKHKY